MVLYGHPLDQSHPDPILPILHLLTPLRLRTFPHLPVPPSTRSRSLHHRWSGDLLCGSPNSSTERLLLRFRIEEDRS